MNDYEFNRMVSSWPVMHKQVGEMEDGTALCVEVHSMFGPAEDDEHMPSAHAS